MLSIKKIQISQVGKSVISIPADSKILGVSLDSEYVYIHILAEDTAPTKAIMVEVFAENQEWTDLNKSYHYLGMCDGLYVFTVITPQKQSDPSS